MSQLAGSMHGVVTVYPGCLHGTCLFSKTDGSEHMLPILFLLPV